MTASAATGDSFPQPQLPTMSAPTLRRAANHASLARHAYRLHKSQDEQVSKQARRHLIERMGKMRGLPQKLGQMLSFSSTREAHDPTAAEDYALLQECAEPLPLETVQPAMEQSWGRTIDEVLESIEPHAHAASLGQVHRAVLRDGRQVAIKVQYPDIRAAVMADLKLLGWLSGPVGNLRRGFDLDAYREVILNDLEHELDYVAEARSQRTFVAWANQDSFLQVPAVIDDLSTSNVLVTEWHEGDRWTEVRDTWPEKQRRALARGLLDFFLKSLFNQGMLHADLHPGNLRFLPTADKPQLLLYDFGCVYRPSDQERITLLRLIHATRLRNESPLPLMLKLGFNREYLEPLANKLPALCQVLFEPFCAEYPYSVSQWRLGERVSDILGEDRLNFRIAGPPAMVFLMRAFHGLSYYMEGLETPVMWGRALDPYLERMAGEMDQLDVPMVNQTSRDFSSLAQYLKIRVVENGRTKVQLTGYATGIDDLDSLLDEPLREKIAEQGIVLSEIVADVRRRGYTPGPVFEMAEGAKTVTVWLE